MRYIDLALILRTLAQKLAEEKDQTSSRFKCLLIVMQKKSQQMRDFKASINLARCS